ncbi:PepSY domain protein [Bacteriovorax sp. BAL6_X]|uniref:PepSY-associated TM helix domain-containing protein n=1 Tax=Bacteriovorax sp. BAL6_X TaxID=1201290 RepID=UPI0003862E07|nr:PepSY-associated TM helix domain-containing protein [Bacteriovorax sp. BAL6_X]EPZ51470.1 PepSY domain protein [Bacteriovorax sp. BAL6_X]
MKFLIHLHRLVGLFVAPFFVIAALSGLFYLLASIAEPIIYKDILFHENTRPHRPLSEQIKSAQDISQDSFKLKSVRPAPSQFETTRVLFESSGMYRQYVMHTIFINPVTLENTGAMGTYGTSGSLPLKTFTDFLHRDLLLNEYGRWYSEVAASWLWIAALGGLAIFLFQRKKRKYKGRLKAHVYIGIAVSFFLVFLSITGLTWSKGAGGEISKLRSAMNWKTPTPSRKINKDYRLNKPLGLVFEEVADKAYEYGLDSKKIEIVKPSSNSAWFVREIERAFPTNVDSVTIHPVGLDLVDHAFFKDFNFVSKLTRWGIDLHMGTLFGLPNQLFLIMVIIALIYLIISGYQLSFSRYKKLRIHLGLLFLNYNYGEKVIISLAIIFISWWLPWFMPFFIIMGILDYLKVKFITVDQ